MNRSSRGITNYTELQDPLQNTTIYFSKREVDEMLSNIRESVDDIWLITATIMIFAMKLGFALLEVGSVRAKNTSNILLKNVLDTVTGALIYFLIGYGLQFDQHGGVIGQGQFAAYGFHKARDFLKLLFFFGFCITSTTIVSGAVAERMYSDTYLVYAVIMTGFISPIATGWAWGGGWLQVIGFHDFCGSGIVHLIGGTAALWGTYVCGPRIGKFGHHGLGSSASSKATQHRLKEFQSKTQQQIRSPSLNSGNEPSQNIKKLSGNVSPSHFRNPSTLSQCSSSLSSQQIEDIRSKLQSMKREQEKFENSSDLPIPMRIHLLRNQYPELNQMDYQTISHLINLYDQNFDQKIESNSMNTIVQGVFLLFVTWLFFNGASGFTIVDRTPQNLPQKIIMNTILSGCMGSITVYLFKQWFVRKMGCQNGYQIIDVCSGLLAGLVSITASCNNVAHWSAIVIGWIGGLVYIWGCIFLIKFKIDDPVEATQVHGFCGAWGVLAVGFFDRDRGLLTGSSHLLGVQALGTIMLFLWTSIISFAYFYMMKQMNRLRVDPIFEVIGLDAVMHEECDKFNHVSAHSIRVAEFKMAMKIESPPKYSIQQRHLNRQLSRSPRRFQSNY